MIYLLKTNWLNKSREQTQRSEVEECAPPKGKRVNIWYCYRELGFPAGASGKEPACQCRRHNRRRFDPWVGKIPWRKKQHSSVLSWRIPWTEEPGGLQSMRSQRVRHDWSDLACTQVRRTRGLRSVSPSMAEIHHPSFIYIVAFPPVSWCPKSSDHSWWLVMGVEEIFECKQPLWRKMGGLFFWLLWVLVAACRIFFAICSLFSGSMWAFSCSMQGLVPWLGMEPWPTALRAWYLNHWTTRNVLGVLLI